MSLKPGDMNCRIAISWLFSPVVGRWANRYRKSRLNRESVGKTGAGIGAKSPHAGSAAGGGNRLFTVYPGVLVDIDWKITTKIWFIPSGISTAKQTGSLSRGRLTGGMIELAIKGALERITGMNAYPLLLPDTVQKVRPFSVSLTRNGLGNVANGDRICVSR